jgi:hypothetical protein
VSDLRIGALGYVVKTHVGTELLPAVEVVRQGRQFLSRALLGHRTDAPDTQSPRSLTQAGFRIAGFEKKEIARNHEVQFYSDDASFLSGFTRFIGAALKAGSAVIVVATESHRNSLFQYLQGQGFDIGAAIEQGSYIPLDVADTLSTFTVNDFPDAVRFLRAAGDLVVAAAKASKEEHPRVAACGECAPFLWAQGKADAAIQLERLWDVVAKSHDVDILCGYQLASFQGGAGSHIFEKICAEHSSVCFQ